MKIIVITIAVLSVSVANHARAEALSTTSAGLGIRTISYVSAKDDSNDPLGDLSGDKNKQKTEILQDPILCQRISTPSSLGVELGAGGCIQGGGFWTFAQSISAFVQLIYYPLASRTQIDNDASISMQRQFLGDFYLLGHGGFAKITHNQSESTNVSLPMDVLEFGGGVGWTYRLFGNVAIGLEGNYLVGSIMSKATTGSTNIIIATGLVTVFL